MAINKQRKTGKIARLEEWVSLLEKHNSQGASDADNAAKLVSAYAALIKEMRREVKSLMALHERSQNEVKSHKERMAVTVHDLKVPITVSLLNLELAGMEPDELEKQNYLTSVTRELEFLLDTISNLLDIEQLESISLTTQPVDLIELMAGIFDRMSIITADKPGLKLLNRLPSNLPKIQADRQKIVRVFNNLLSNAIKYTDSGSVTVTARHGKKDKIVSISVEDTGSGIEPDRLPQLFKMFHGDSKRSDSSGVGLAFVKLAVEAHGGSVVLKSKKGRGTVVVVNFYVCVE